MKYVYVLESFTAPGRHYVGGTADLKKRFAEHNRGESLHTSKFIAWKLVTYIAFSDHEKADNFRPTSRRAPGMAFAGKHC